MSNTDPDATIEEQAQTFVILTAIKKADGKPYPLRQLPDGGLFVIADLPESTNGKTLALTGGADQLPDVALKAGLVIENDEDNLNDIRVGGSDVTIAFGFRLTPGESVPIATENQNTVYIFGVVGDKVHYLSG